MTIEDVFGKIQPPDWLTPYTQRQPIGAGGISLFLSNLIKLIFAIAAIVLVFMLIWGAYEWIVSGGDKEAVAKARGRILNALIGLAVLAVAFALAVVAAQFLGFANLNSIIIPGPQ